MLTVAPLSGPPAPIIADTINNHGQSAASNPQFGQLNRSNSLGANQRGGGESSHVQSGVSSLSLLPSLDGGGVKAVNVDGGGGSRLKGPGGQPGQLNGMPSKKSQSTSKLSVKGEQGNYQAEREVLLWWPRARVRQLGTLLYLYFLLTEKGMMVIGWLHTRTQ